MLKTCNPFWIVIQVSPSVWLIQESEGFPCFWKYCSSGHRPGKGRILNFAASNLFGDYPIAPLLISSTTFGSSSVVVSPRFDVSPSATLRKILRIIFPDRVFGRPLTN